MKTTEESALLAVLNDDEKEAEKLVATMLPGEKAALMRACTRLSMLCEAD